MAVPGFRPKALDEDGGPLWIDSLANEDPKHVLHVVRGLSPVAAIELVGGRVLRELTPGELPAERSDEWHTPAHADYEINMRIVCVLAGLTWTPDELRAEPLLIGEVSESSFYDVMAKVSQAGPSAAPRRDLQAPNGWTRPMWTSEQVAVQPSRTAENTSST